MDTFTMYISTANDNDMEIEVEFEYEEAERGHRDRWVHRLNLIIQNQLV